MKESAEKHRQMRAELKAAGIHTPRANVELERVYATFKGEPVLNKPVLRIVKDEPVEDVYTYIGSGDSPPQMIKFMGVQIFIRGTPTKVTDKRLLRKIAGNPCFVQGPVDMEALYVKDEEEKRIVEEKRERDKKLNDEVEKSYRQWAFR